MFKRFLKGLKHAKEQPRVIKQRHHDVSQDDISPNALKVLYRLKHSGYGAFLVGGGVRDMLLQHKPKDFDIVTNARPHEIRQLFRNSRLIGRRFRLVHVYFPNEIIEVSTFRANAEELLRDPALSETKGKRPGMLLEDNTYGTIEEDAWRRDFTVNALYYDIADSSVVDFTGGIEDLKHAVIRMIGDPIQRYHEDPIRLLRAIRLAAKLNFKIDPKTKEPLLTLHGLLRHVPISRLFYEVTKLFFEGYAFPSYQLMTKMGYMQALFPHAFDAIAQMPNFNYATLIELAMQATDERYANQQSLNPGFLFGVLLWPVVQDLLQRHYREHRRWFPALYHGVSTALRYQSETVPMPRRLTAMMRSIWTLQYHLERQRPSRIYRIFHQRYFRAAIDFLQLRAKAGEPLHDIVTWWRTFQEGSQRDRERLIDELQSER